MQNNEQFKMEIKNNIGTYTDLMPKTVQSQVLDWGIGETYGPYTIVLHKDKWIDYQQTVNFNGVTNSDIVACIKVLSGTREEMIEQDKAYAMIRHVGGIESLNNAIRFTCDEVPPIDIQVQVWWTK